MHRIERPRSLTELVSEALRQQIVEGELELGEMLSEARIAQLLDVSRTPVREAFARLEREGLVRTEPQRGTFVFTLSAKQLTDICHVRGVLETAALRQSMERARPQLAETLRGTLKEMTAARRQRDDRSYLRLDARFHEELFAHTDNAFLLEAYATISAKMAALRNRLGAHADHMDKSFREHRRIAELVAEGAVDEAEAVLVAHIGRKEGSYWNLQDAAEPGEARRPALARAR